MAIPDLAGILTTSRGTVQRALLLHRRLSTLDASDLNECGGFARSIHPLDPLFFVLLNQRRAIFFGVLHAVSLLAFGLTARIFQEPLTVPESIPAPLRAIRRCWVDSRKNLPAFLAGVFVSGGDGGFFHAAKMSDTKDLPSFSQVTTFADT